MRNKLIFLVQYIKVCRDFEVFGNIRYRMTRLPPKCPQSRADYRCVVIIIEKCPIFPHRLIFLRIRFRDCVCLLQAKQQARSAVNSYLPSFRSFRLRVAALHELINIVNSLLVPIQNNSKEMGN